ncbi:MAG TPA: 4-hydroxybenzoate octaprenyltransferase [Gammaproteobacteria bacterium]|nr:4-hydroxybenzoate octaprenyltransferase [Gammaproteobacteria bacterium]
MVKVSSNPGVRGSPWWPSKEQWRNYVRLMRLDKPIGIFLLLWPTLWALWIAGNGRPDPLVAVVFISGVVLMRSAGCVINDLADRDFDAHVKRTRERPLASGKVSPEEAVRLFSLLITGAFLLVMLMNTLTILLSFVGALLAATYPFTKRYIHLPQVHLGLAFGWAVPMTFAAQTGTVPKIAWLLLIATLLWAVAYDTMYAMVDREDDIRIGVKSTAILFGDADRPIIGIIQLLMLTVMLIVGHEARLGWTYYVGLATAALFALYQQYLIKDREPARCFQAFLNNNWFGAVIFFGIVGGFLR